MSAVLAVWPEHERYIEGSLRDRSETVLATSEQISALLLRLADSAAGGLDALCSDYRFMCQEIVLPEEVYFRRNEKYRLSSFAEAYQEVYSNREKMDKYMTGLLLSNVLWDPHARSIEHYVTNYLPSYPMWPII